MTARSLKARLISLFAITLTSLVCMTLVQITHAQRSGQHSENQRVSLLLKGNNHSANETVTVIVTLGGPRSGRLNAFLQQNGVSQRREMRSLRSFSVSLPFGMVAELAAFPEVLYVSSNEAVSTLGHVSTTTGAAAGEAAAATAGRGTR